MKKTVSVFLFVLVLLSVNLSACGSGKSPLPTPSKPDIETEEVAVYAALIQSMYTADMLVIMDTTATDPGGVENTGQFIQMVLKNMKGISTETTDSFSARNEAAHSLRADMELAIPYTLLSEAEMREMFNVNQNGWQEFYNRYPSAPGIITLSRAGFNTAADQALVYIGNQGHWLAGAGYYVLLKKVDGAWIVDQKVMSWIS